MRSTAKALRGVQTLGGVTLAQAQQLVPLGVCLRNNVLNDNRLYESYYYDIPHI